MLTSILIVVAAIIFSYLGFKKVKISREQLEYSQKQIELSREQLEISKKQIEVSQKAQYSEQFLKSVELLASKDLEELLGGLASLDDLSRVNKEEYKRGWEYLGNFLRHHKPLQPEAEKPYPEVEAIAKMLRERNTDYEDENFRLNLSKANLEGVNLSEANLEGVNLSEANLERAFLYRVNLWGANLEDSNLEGANLEEAKLEGANLEGANLEGVNLGRANLEEANLSGANLKKTRLGEANLSFADLNSANLGGAFLWKANLEGALFGGTGEAQDLTDLIPERLQGTYYDDEYPIPKLPEGISEKDKPQKISYGEWFEKYRFVGWFKKYRPETFQN